MSAQPKRIQRKRTKGWRMPENAVYVGRPTRWGNEFEVGANVTRKEAVDRYVIHLATYFGWVEREVAKAFYPWPVRSREFENWVKPLRGKDLACWCPLEDENGNRVPCHADVLLELANGGAE